jgi:hypothetical protein
VHGLPAARGNYRLTTEAVHPQRFGPTSAVSAEWTFTSSYVDSVVDLPVNVMRFSPALSEDGSAPAGETLRVPVRMQNETGAYERPRELTVEVSYDEGTSWQRVRVSRDLV